MLAQARMLNITNTYKTWAKLKHNAVVFMLINCYKKYGTQKVSYVKPCDIEGGESYDTVCTYDDLYPF